MSAAASLLAGRRVIGPASARLNIDGRDYLNFYGSGYLALSEVTSLWEAVSAWVARDPARALAAAPAGRPAPELEALERAAAQALGTETSLCLPSGYLIGMAGLAALADEFGIFLIDETAHYSLVDAARLSGAQVHSFAHCDADALAAALRTHVLGRQRPLVVTDGVFAATGRVPPLADYAALLAPYDGRMFVDEAHGFGVLGPSGRGVADLCGVAGIAHVGATFTKAYCAAGAAIGCSLPTAERLRAMPRIAAFLGMAPFAAVAARASLDYAAGRPAMRAPIAALTLYLRRGLARIGIATEPSPAPIVAFRLGTARAMRRVQARLFEQGIFILHASGYVGCGAEGVLRCAIFRNHCRADIDRLLATLQRS